MKRIALALIVLLADCAGGGSEDANAVAAAEPNEASPSETAKPAAAPDAASAAARSGRPAVEAPERAGGEGEPKRPNGAANACSAGRYRHLVGQHRSRIPPRPAGETWRVTCTSCPMTMDYSERRLNILYDERSGIIEQVRCG